MAKKVKPKKRGVKPGTKRGRYRKANTTKEFTITSVAGNSFKVGDIVSFDNAATPVALSLVETLDAAIARLEVAVGNSIDRINSLVGKF